LALPVTVASAMAVVMVRLVVAVVAVVVVATVPLGTPEALETRGQQVMLVAEPVPADQVTPARQVMLGQTVMLIPVPLEPTETPEMLATQEVLVLTCQIL
tara:strand:+ start:26150 stop:26449 length:300 start_codon:yes stop_codon:yes gene_type:complete